MSKPTCKHDPYWRGIYGTCQACRSENAERERDEAIKYGKGQHVALGICIEERDELKRRLENNDKEIGKFQNDVKNLLDEKTGSNVDGAGSDSGDWRDFTLSEISQGLAVVAEQRDQLRVELAAAKEQLEALRKDKDRLDWLESVSKSISGAVHFKLPNLNCWSGSIRTAIDTAMK